MPEVPPPPAHPAKAVLNAAQRTQCRLQIHPGTAGFQIVATGFIHGEKSLWYEETLCREDVYEFRNRIGGVGAAMVRLVDL